MSTPYRLEWGENQVQPIGSLGDLDRWLDALDLRARAAPFMVELVSPAGDNLAAGLGRAESVLSWVPASGNPPYYASKGDERADGTVVFSFRTHWSEFPRWSAVPPERMRAAMPEFLVTGTLPQAATWEEV